MDSKRNRQCPCRCNPRTPPLLMPRQLENLAVSRLDNGLSYSLLPRRKGKTHWHCRCLKCGKESDIPATNLKSKRSLSCRDCKLGSKGASGSSPAKKARHRPRSEEETAEGIQRIRSTRGRSLDTCGFGVMSASQTPQTLRLGSRFSTNTARTSVPLVSPDAVPPIDRKPAEVGSKLYKVRDS